MSSSKDMLSSPGTARVVTLMVSAPFSSPRFTKDWAKALRTLGLTGAMGGSILLALLLLATPSGVRALNVGDIIAGGGMEMEASLVLELDAEIGAEAEVAGPGVGRGGSVTTGAFFCFCCSSVVIVGGTPLARRALRSFALAASSANMSPRELEEEEEEGEDALEEADETGEGVAGHEVDVGDVDTVMREGGGGGGGERDDVGGRKVESGGGGGSMELPVLVNVGINCIGGDAVMGGGGKVDVDVEGVEEPTLSVRLGGGGNVEMGAAGADVEVEVEATAAAELFNARCCSDTRACNLAKASICSFNTRICSIISPNCSPFKGAACAGSSAAAASFASSSCIFISCSKMACSIFCCICLRCLRRF